MAQPRTQRIEAEIQRVLAALIAREVKDPRVGNVTSPRSSMAADLSSARIFLRPLPRATHPSRCAWPDACRRLPARGTRTAARAAARAAPGVRVRCERGRGRAADAPHRGGGGGGSRRRSGAGRRRTRQPRSAAALKLHRCQAACCCSTSPSACRRTRPCSGCAALCSGEGRPRRQPRSARHRHAADLPRRGDQDRRRHSRRTQALPLQRRLWGDAPLTGDAEGEVTSTAPYRRSPRRACTRRSRDSSAPRRRSRRCTRRSSATGSRCTSSRAPGSPWSARRAPSSCSICHS